MLNPEKSGVMFYQEIKDPDFSWATLMKMLNDSNNDEGISPFIYLINELQFPLIPEDTLTNRILNNNINPAVSRNGWKKIVPSLCSVTKHEVVPQTIKTTSGGKYQKIIDTIVFNGLPSGEYEWKHDPKDETNSQRITSKYNCIIPNTHEIWEIASACEEHISDIGPGVYVEIKYQEFDYLILTFLLSDKIVDRVNIKIVPYLLSNPILADMNELLLNVENNDRRREL
jgi:hypothetical protein